MIAYDGTHKHIYACKNVKLKFKGSLGISLNWMEFLEIQIELKIKKALVIHTKHTITYDLFLENTVCLLFFWEPYETIWKLTLPFAGLPYYVFVKGRHLPWVGYGFKLQNLLLL